MPPGTKTIVSVFPRPIFNRNYSFWQGEMNACPKCEKHERAPCEKCLQYAELRVSAVRDPIDDPNATDGSGRRFDVISAEDLANCLLVDGCIDRGAFVAAGDKPTRAELEAAVGTYKTWAEALVREADDLWGQKRDATKLNPHAHDAARFLGLKREWLSDTAARKTCDACGEYNLPGVALCRGCHTPIDWEKARDLGALTAEQVRFGLATGKLQRRAGLDDVEEDKPTDDTITTEDSDPPHRRQSRRHVYGG